VSRPILQLAAVVKHYHALRPLRIERFSLADGEQAAILGFDAPAAEIFVNLLTGATLPDAGSVEIFGKATREITDSAEWLPLVDRIGIVSGRGTLLEAMSPLQNIALPHSIDIDPLNDDAREAAVALAREVALPESDWPKPVAELSAGGRLKVRLARAVALDPALVVLEHPAVDVDLADARAIAMQIRDVFRRRAAASLTIAADASFAATLADRILTLDPSTGRLSAGRGGWFRRTR